jgi:hypothetical protein
MSCYSRKLAREPASGEDVIDAAAISHLKSAEKALMVTDTVTDKSGLVQ